MPALPRNPRPVTVPPVLTLTATRQLTANESGSKVIFDSTTAFTVTLPAPSKGLEFDFFVKQAAGATGHTIGVTTGAKMFGKVSPTGAAATATASKGRTNTQATSVVGDGLKAWSDGTDWYYVPTGIWATQA